MQIDLTKALEEENWEQQTEALLEISAIACGKEEFPVLEKEPVYMTITHTGKQRLTLSGHTKITVAIPCDRCLKEVPVDFPLDFTREINFGSLDENPEEALEISNFIEKNILDIDAFICNEVLAQWPMKVLCSDSCKGICKKCGKDLNEGSCDCEQEELDPRMAAIRDIFYQNYKEEV